MLFVRTHELKAGMRLARPIYNKNGVLLYERDTKLAMQGIYSIKNFGLIGIYILEPAEPLPPMTEDDIEFERFQTMAVFALKDIYEAVENGKRAISLPTFVSDIMRNYGHVEHKMNFMQNIRSKEDAVYKHSLNVAILSALISNRMHMTNQEQIKLITDEQKKELDLIASNPFINQAETDYINLWELAGTEPAIKKFIDGIKPLLAKREQEQILAQHQEELRVKDEEMLKKIALEQEKTKQVSAELSSAKKHVDALILEGQKDFEKFKSYLEDEKKRYETLSLRTQEQEKLAVESGYWHLWRFHPELEVEGKNGFTLDSKEPDWSKFQDFIMSEIRYNSLVKSFPEEAKVLFKATEENAKWRYNVYKKLAEEK